MDKYFLRKVRVKFGTFGHWVKGSQEVASEGPTVLNIGFSRLSGQVQVAAWDTSPDMTTVFHARSYGRFIEQP